MNDYTSADLMAAILSTQDATAISIARLETKIEGVDRNVAHLRDDMDRRFDRLLDDMDSRFARVDARFDRMDERFDRLEDRVTAIEPRGHSPAS